MTAGDFLPETGPVLECVKCPPSPSDGRRASYIDDELGRRAHVRVHGHRPEPAGTRVAGDRP